MDLRRYYQSIRHEESKLPAEYALVISLDTSDGGKAGSAVEVTRRMAAKMIVEGRARLATDTEAEAHRTACDQARRAADAATGVARTQIAVLSESEVRAIKAALKSGKE